MRTSLKAAIGGAMVVGLLVVGGSPANAAIVSGNKSCSSNIRVSSTAASTPGQVYERHHAVNDYGYWNYTTGYWTRIIPALSGNWVVTVYGGTISSASATCSGAS